MTVREAATGGRRPAPLRLRLLAAILAPLLFLGILESALRIAGFRYEPEAPLRTGGGEADHGHLYRPDPDLLWTLHPRTVLHDPQLGFIQVRTNALGLRGPDLPKERRPEEVRVLCLGDSITFGLGVGHGRSWPRQLERLLENREELAGRPVTILNGAVPGWSSIQGMQLLRRLDGFDPDVIVFWFGANDVQYRGARDADLIAGGGPRRWLAARLAPLRTAQLARRVAAALGVESGPPSRVSREEFAAAVADLSARAAGGGPHVLFVSCPGQYARTISQLGRVLSRARESGAGFVVAPLALLSPNTPAPRGMDFEGRVVPGPDGPELHLAGPLPTRLSLARIEAHLRAVNGWSRALAERLADLPPDSPGYADLFGDLPPWEVFIDNLHLSVRGNRLAAESLAERIVPLLLAR